MSLAHGSHLPICGKWLQRASAFSRERGPRCCSIRTHKAYPTSRPFDDGFDCYCHGGLGSIPHQRLSTASQGRSVRGGSPLHARAAAAGSEDEGILLSLIESRRFDEAGESLMANVIAGIMPSEWSVSAMFTALENQQETERMSRLLERLGKGGCSHARLCTAFNCTARALAREPGRLRAALDLLKTMAQTENLDVYYETFNVIAQSCDDNGMPEKAERVMQLRYSTYHSTD